MHRKMKALLHVAAVFVIFIFTSSFSEVAFQRGLSSVKMSFLYSCLHLWSAFTAVHLYAKYVMRVTLAEIQIKKPRQMIRWFLVGTFLMAAVVGFYLAFTKGKLEYGNPTKGEVFSILVSDVLGQGVRTVMIEELLYRGLALYALRKGFGKSAAVWISGLAYALIRLWIAPPSDLNEFVWLMGASSLMGTALSLVVYESGSVWPSMMIHTVYYIFSGNSQILHIDMEQNFPAVWTYTLENESWLLAGVPGEQMIHTALPGMIFFLSIGVLAMKWIKKRNERDSDGTQQYIND